MFIIKEMYIEHQVTILASRILFQIPKHELSKFISPDELIFKGVM